MTQVGSGPGKSSVLNPINQKVRQVSLYRECDPLFYLLSSFHPCFPLSSFYLPSLSFLPSFMLVFVSESTGKVRLVSLGCNYISSCKMMSVTSDINACRDGIVGVGREGEWVGVGVGKREGESDADVKICLRGRQRERERERERVYNNGKGKQTPSDSIHLICFFA